MGDNLKAKEVKIKGKVLKGVDTRRLSESIKYKNNNKTVTK